MPQRNLVLAAMVILTAAPLSAADAPAPEWIWQARARQPGQHICLQTKITVSQRLVTAELIAVADFCHAVFFVDGKRVAQRAPYDVGLRLEISDQLPPGEHTLGVLCQSVDGPAAVAVRLQLRFADGRKQLLLSDATWQAATIEHFNHQWPTNIKPADWQVAATFGKADGALWKAVEEPITVNATEDYTQWKRALKGGASTAPSNIEVPTGFEVTLLRSAAKDEGSWVSLTPDPTGRWIIAKEKKGLLRLTLPNIQTKSPAFHEGVIVESINDSLAECRGLLFSQGNLYAMANNDLALFRLRDTTGDDQFDNVVELTKFAGSVGHGRNQLALGPDGMIYAIFGDAVFEPEHAKQLVPSLSHPNRHETERSGYVARTADEGATWEVVVRGLRNPFGIDFNRQQDMFTYDADAEYDMGAPWYRPTRINHLLPGGDFGWRRVTKSWPPYFPDRPDMPQPTLDIGKGSPTAVVFCSGTQFPPQYRNTLFALDWAYGRILAVDCQPRGSSYAAAATTFVRGRPLNVTDVEFGPDGAMYFITGGRGTQSAFYRVEYTGAQPKSTQPTRQDRDRNAHAESSRIIRRSLESLLGQPNPQALALAWPQLSSSNPWIRHVARAVVETQQVENWRERALAEVDSNAALAALTALARRGELSDLPRIAQRLHAFPLNELPLRQQAEALFLSERCLAMDSPLTKQQRGELANELNALYPSIDAEINLHLSRLLAPFEPAEFVARTLVLLERANGQQQKLNYLFVLRHVNSGWTPELRNAYFAQLRLMNDFISSEGMPTFRKLIHDEALAAIPEDERPQWASILKQEAEPWLTELVDEQREFVRKWTVSDFQGLSSIPTDKANIEHGRTLFASAKCVVCHRVGRRGGVSGPDLTSVSRRFNPTDLLVSMIEPSKVVSDKYENSTFVLADGRVINGRILPGDYRAPSLTIVPNLLEPQKTIDVKKSEIEARQRSTVSPMPQSLLDTLTREEILDLLAYLAAAETHD